MFKSLSLARQILILFIGIAIVAVVLAGVTFFYKNNIKTGVVKDLTIDTNKQEGEAIEQANDIDAMHSQLSDSAVDTGLLLDFRSEDSPEDQPSERVQSVSGDQASQSGYNGHKTTGVQTQQPIPQPLPSEATEWQEAWQPSTVPANLVKPCHVTYGFDDSRNIIEIKVCE